MRPTPGPGLEGETVRETGTVRGEFAACGELTVMVAPYVPAASPAIETPTLIVPGAGPPAVSRTTHGWSTVADHDSVPLPPLVMLSGLVAGVAPPTVAV